MRGTLLKASPILVILVASIPLLAPETLALGDPFFASPSTAADFGASARPFGVAAGDFDADGNDRPGRRTHDGESPS